jgi:hypothetical protein
MKRLFLLVVMAGIATAFYSCCKAGTGGKATVICHVVNANTGAPVNNMTIYVAYGTSRAPVTLDKFNEHKPTGTTGSTATFSNLKCGTYFLYAVGYDSAVSLPIKGGGPYSLLHANRNKTEDATISVSY